MKKLYLILATVAFCSFANAQTDSKNAAPATKPAVEQAQPEILILKETEHDFGKIPQGKPVVHEFEVVNNSKEALTLENVQASCGCTTPTWSKEPIPAGKTAVIKVGYNAANAGHFEKFITIYYGGGKTKMYKIHGDVWQTPAEAAPANKGTSTLKEN